AHRSLECFAGAPMRMAARSGLTFRIPLQEARIVASVANAVRDISRLDASERHTHSLTSLHSGAKDADMAVAGDEMLSCGVAG
nr:hypothetical protein [Tanacetum cinerariifolium]